MRRPLRRAELLAKGLKRRRVVVVAVHIAQQAAQLVKSRSIDSAVLLEAVARPGPELVEVPAGLGHADDRHIEVAALHHRLQRRENFLVGQIAGGAEKDQGIRMGIVHSFCPHVGGFFQMSAELVAHRRKQFVREIRLAARAETLVERGRQDMRRHGLVDGGLDRPAPFAGIRDPAGEIRQRRDLRPGRSPSGPAATRRSRCRAATPPRCQAD